jgi:hypothetical protein
MRQDNIEAAKAEVETILRDYLRHEDIEIVVPPQINTGAARPFVIFDGIQGMRLEGSLLQWEIRVILGVLGPRLQCRRLVDGVYRALAAYRPTAAELTALLTSLHVEVTHFANGVSKRATIRCILGEG